MVTLYMYMHRPVHVTYFECVDYQTPTIINMRTVELGTFALETFNFSNENSEKRYFPSVMQ